MADPQTESAELSSHADKYDPDAYMQYTFEEFDMWIHLLQKRAKMRTDLAKRAKDLQDAANYAEMRMLKAQRVHAELQENATRLALHLGAK